MQGFLRWIPFFADILDYFYGYLICSEVVSWFLRLNYFIILSTYDL